MDTQGRKDDANKPRLALLSAPAIWELGEVLTSGADKYGANNWRKGIDYTRLLSATLRHVLALVEGEDLDQESGLHHAAHAMAELMFMLDFYMEGRSELDDRGK